MAGIVNRVDESPDPPLEADVDELIIRVLSGTASHFEAERLKRWRGQSPENEMAYQDMAQVWKLTTPENPGEVPPGPDLEEILVRAQSAGLPLQAEGKTRPMAGDPKPRTRTPGARAGRWLPPGRWWLLAASLAALSLGISLTRTLGPTPLAVHQAPPDQTLMVNLPDGSLVKLAEGARLQEWEGEGERVVSLEGRAFFAVARDEDRPFEVRASGGRVRVLGTRFELRAQPEDLRTVVIEGRVEVSNQEGAVEVGPGEVALAREDTPPSISTPQDVYDLLQWPDGLLVFQATPMKLVVEEVSRFFQRPLMVDGGPMEDRRITAWFQGESFQEVAEALCQAAGAVCRQDDGGLRIGDPRGEGRTP